MPAEGRGRGKLILVGEHAVVYGHPAIALGVGRGIAVRLTERPGPTGVSEACWRDERVAAALAAVLPAEGLDVDIRSELPIGRGMGSSAALAVALVRAEAARTGEQLDDDAVFDRAFAVERVFHGNPSGLDHAVSARGGVLWYRRGDPPTLDALPCPAWRLVVLDSGSSGNTAQLVAGVLARRPEVDPLLDRIGAIVAQARGALDQPVRLGALMSENHALLRRLGVSTPVLDELVDLAMGAGAYGAKLSGAGGGGVVIALVDRPDRVLAAARSAGIEAFACQPARSDA